MGLDMVMVMVFLQELDVDSVGPLDDEPEGTETDEDEVDMGPVEFAYSDEAEDSLHGRQSIVLSHERHMFVCGAKPTPKHKVLQWRMTGRVRDMWNYDGIEIEEVSGSVFNVIQS